MTFVEWLRVRNAVRGLAIVLGVFALIALIVRVGLNDKLNMEYQVLHAISGRNGDSHVTRTTLPNGVRRIYVRNDDDDMTATIDVYPDGNDHVVITEPQRRHHEDLDSFNLGSMHMNETEVNGVRTSTIDTNGTVPIYYYVMISTVVGLVMATLLAAPFARERDGHLEIALTKPVSRIGYAFGVIGVDLAGILICEALMVVAMIVVQAFFEVPHVDFININGWVLVSAAIFPFTWYAMICAASTALSRGYGAVLGFSWPIALVVAGLGSGGFDEKVLGDTMLGQLVHQGFWVIARIDPLTYMNFSHSIDPATLQLIMNPQFIGNLSIATLLLVVYGALAIVQWRRVEA